MVELSRDESHVAETDLECEDADWLGVVTEPVTEPVPALTPAVGRRTLDGLWAVGVEPHADAGLSW